MVQALRVVQRHARAAGDASAVEVLADFAPAGVVEWIAPPGLAH